MIIVYWRESPRDPDARFAPRPCMREFPGTALAAALEWTAALRKSEPPEGIDAIVSHVTISVENADSVGLPGVADPDADYNWKKRRGDLYPPK